MAESSKARKSRPRRSVKELVATDTAEALEELAAIMRSADESEDDRVAAAIAILDLGYGEPDGARPANCGAALRPE